MTGETTKTEYDAYYFAHGCGRPYQRDDEWLSFFGTIADHIVEEIQPSTVLDAGCAMGFLVEALRARGVEAWGVDISDYAIQQVHPDVRAFCWQGSVVDPLPQEYDLIVCIEVLEHLQPEDSVAALENLCRHSDDILFSSTPFDYKEATHFNVQPPEYWAAHFARQGFYRDVDFDGSFITPWAARFRKQDEPTHRIIRDYERRFWLLWKENTDLRDLSTELRNELSVARARITMLETQVVEHQETIDDIVTSPAWRLIERLHPIRLRLAPPESRRERLLLSIVDFITRSSRAKT